MSKANTVWLTQKMCSIAAFSTATWLTLTARNSQFAKGDHFLCRSQTVPLSTLNQLANTWK